MKVLKLLVILLIVFSCNENVKKEDAEENSLVVVDEKKVDSTNEPSKEDIEKEITKSEQSLPVATFKQVNIETDSIHKDKLGYYVGDFSMVGDEGENENGSFTNKINISIDALTKDSIYGHSVVAGNIRPFKGVFNLEIPNITVKEPGDDKYDGVFKFHFKDNVLIGSWFANNKSLPVNERTYYLEKTSFNYNLNHNIEKIDDGYDVILLSEKHEINYSGEYEKINTNKIANINASKHLLKNKDVENLSKGELEVLRNLIYARHGYSFKNRKMRYFFDDNIDWYIPVSTDVRKELTDIEKQNIDLIKRYEQHAERYYDSFGR